MNVKKIITGLVVCPMIFGSLALPHIGAAAAEIIKNGDIDGDRAISAADASLVLTEYSLLSTGSIGLFTADQTAAADVNGDGSVNSSDASAILAFYAYISTGGEEIDIKEWVSEYLNLRYSVETDRIAEGFTGAVKKTAPWSAERVTSDAVIHSADELISYLSEFYSDSAAEKFREKYDEKFFDDNILLLNTMYQMCGDKPNFKVDTA